MSQPIVDSTDFSVTPITTGELAIAYIENYHWFVSHPGLERMRLLMRLLGDPQNDVKYIHVGGSNGKGSACAMLDSILRSAGYRTGLYTSPYIETFNERIRVDGRDITPEELAGVTERVRLVAEAMDDHPTRFELLTAAAFCYYQERKCDIVVLEVGMGGELDATNVIPAPEVAALMNIGLEHTEYLGDTLEKIAATKSGIIKPGCTAVLYDGVPEVTAVIDRVCAERKVPLIRARTGDVALLSRSLKGQRFTYHGETYELRLLGDHQLANTAVVMNVIAALRERGMTVPETALKEGLKTVRWPARLEVLSEEPLFLLDGGHNPQCAEALAKALPDVLNGKKATFLIGILADKDYNAMLDTVLPYMAEAVCITPDSPRALPAEELANRIIGRGIPAVSAADVPAAVDAALTSGRPVVAFGSLYSAGLIRTCARGLFSGPRG